MKKKALDRMLKCLYRFEIWQTHWQQCCRGACQFPERSDNSKLQVSRLRDFTRSYNTTSYRILKQGLVSVSITFHTWQANFVMEPRIRAVDYQRARCPRYCSGIFNSSTHKLSSLRLRIPRYQKRNTHISLPWRWWTRCKIRYLTHDC